MTGLHEWAELDHRGLRRAATAVWRCSFCGASADAAVPLRRGGPAGTCAERVAAQVMDS